jgi:hypothetical protein
VLGPAATGQLACANDCSFDTAQCCLPACSGKQCGPDGCGGVCGTCSGATTCSSGQCVCVPSCSGKQCGSDGCGGTCGTCASGTSCSNGKCVCTPNCGYKTCGPDGCGGTCGTCTSAQYCEGNYSLCVDCSPECNSYSTASVGSNDNCYAWGQHYDCKYCNSSCGVSGRMVTCNGTTNPPPLSGCKRINWGTAGDDGSYCCQQGACLRYTNGDAYCAYYGKPPKAYSCTTGSTPPSSCVEQTYGSTKWWCCP